MSSERTYCKELPKKHTELIARTSSQNQVEPKDTTDTQSVLSKENDDDPFEPAEKSLLVTTCAISGIPARILIDDGAEINQLSLEFCDKYRIPIERTDHTASMANHVTQEWKFTTNPVTVQIKGYSESMRFSVSPLSYDLILGKQWAYKHRAKIDCYKNEVTFQHKNRNHTIIADEPATSSMISTNNFLKLERSGFPLYAVAMKPIDYEETSETRPIPSDIKKILKDFSDVFPQKLPSGLPRKEIVNSTLI